MKKVYFSSALIFSVLFVMFLGCGSGGGGTSSTDEGVSGTITAARYYLASGETLRVSGDLTIESNESVVIDGDIVALNDRNNFV